VLGAVAAAGATGSDRLPAVLLPYQQRILAATATNALTVVEKSRRIGATWGVAADAVLTAAAEKAAGGMDALYIGFSLDMAREFIDTAGAWAKAFNMAAAAVDEVLFPDGDDREILAFRISFASGFEIVALSSRPRSLRGRQGCVIIDEAAFVDDLPELLKAALALLIWGGKVLVISSHNGVENAFNGLCEEIRQGTRPGTLLKITIDDALADGLYRRVCLVTGRPWSPEAETAWRAEIFAIYGDGADEELLCIPRRSGGKYIPLALAQARAAPGIPVCRWSCDDGFALQPDHVRDAAAEAWCRDALLPVLCGLPTMPSTFGVDFGRVCDLTVIWALQIDALTRRRTRLVAELRNTPHTQQRQILWFVVDRLPRLWGGAMDAGGSGSYLAEVTWQRYGACIHKIQLSQPWYAAHVPPFKAHLGSEDFDLPLDRDVLTDVTAFEVIRGVPLIPPARTKGADGGGRHGDAGVAAVLADFAASQEPVSYDYEGVPRQRAEPGRLPDTPDALLAEEERDRGRFKQGAF
jgi:phage FluMu gp28-like protein